MEHYKHEKLTLEHFESERPRQAFTHFQRDADLQAHGQERVEEAMKAAVGHITKTHGLSGMHANHIDEAMQYLTHRYENRSKLGQKEKEVIEKSFNHHFFGKAELPDS